MSDIITYQYHNPSALLKSAAGDELFLSKYSEVQKKEAPCFFWGRLEDPFITARCLITLSNVVQSSFSLSPFELAKNSKIRSLLRGMKQSALKDSVIVRVYMPVWMYYPEDMMGSSRRTAPPM